MPFWVRNSRTAFASLPIAMLTATMRLPSTFLLSRSKPGISLRQGGHQVARTLNTGSLPRNA